MPIKFLLLGGGGLGFLKRGGGGSANFIFIWEFAKGGAKCIVRFWGGGGNVP